MKPARSTAGKISRLGAKGAASAASGRVTQRFAVPAMDCESCSATVRAAMRTVPGVFAVSPNVGAREVAVTFDSARVSVQDIRTRLDAAGYPESE